MICATCTIGLSWRTKVEIESLVNSGDSQALERTIDEIKHRVKDEATQARF